MRDYRQQTAGLRGAAKGLREIDMPKTAEQMDDAADAIEELNKALDAVNDAHNEGYDVGYWAARRDYEPRWISVEERLPEFHVNDSGCVCTGNIVFRTEYKTLHLGYVIRTAHNNETVYGFEQILMDRWYNQTGEMIEDVTHWMPLPTSPGGAE